RADEGASGIAVITRARFARPPRFAGGWSTSSSTSGSTCARGRGSIRAARGRGSPGGAPGGARAPACRVPRARSPSRRRGSRGSGGGGAAGRSPSTSGRQISLDRRLYTPIYICMDMQSAAFVTLADPTRRAILDVLRLGERPVNDLVDAVDIH